MSRLTLSWTDADQDHSRILDDQQPTQTSGTFRLGRDPNQCDVVFQEVTVSALHVELFFDVTSGRLFLRNLGSKNPPVVNGKVVDQRPIPLDNGSTILLGKLTLQVTGIQYRQDLPPQVATTEIMDWSREAKPLVRQQAIAHQLGHLLPVVFSWSELQRRGWLTPGILIVGMVTLMFSNVGNPVGFNILLGLSMAFGALYIINQLCESVKPWWLLLVVVNLTIILTSSPVFDGLTWLFREVLPGGDLPSTADFAERLLNNFLGAGLCEELIKALPVVIVLAVGLVLPPSWRPIVGVWEPLDGILLGAAAGMGFTCLETLTVYVPQLVWEVSTSGGSGELYGLQLLIPRLLSAIAVHLAYSGYFGYFIGLTMLRPHQWWILIPVGYLTAAVLHAFWNSVDAVSWQLIVGMVSYACLVAAILKGRQLSPRLGTILR